MRQTLIAATVEVAALMPVAVPAIEYYEDRPLMFTYQNKAGYWFGCGPTQCLQTGYRSEESAISKIDGYKKGEYSYLGSYGRCDVYQALDGKMSAGDISPARVVARMQKRC